MGEFQRRVNRIGVRPLFGVLLLLALGYMLPQISYMWQHWNAQDTPSWVGTFPGDPTLANHAADIDTWFIHGGLVKAPHFRDTWQWWVGTWVGQVPFYRPLTSMVFWVEWQLCGDREPRYILFAMVLHLLVVAQFGRVSYALFRFWRCPYPQWAMLIAGLVFVDGLYCFPTRQLSNLMVFAFWKNQPDSLCALFFLLALSAYLNALPNAESPLPGDGGRGAACRAQAQGAASSAPTGRALGGGRGISGVGWAAIWFAASCLSKEAGSLLPLLLLSLEAPYLRSGDRAARRQALRRLAPQFGVLVGFLVLRAVCLAQVVGFRYGDNGDWPVRLVNELFGPLLRITYWHHPLILLLGLGLAVGVGWWLWRRQRGEQKPLAPARVLAGVGMLCALLLLMGLLTTPGGLGRVLRGYASHITVSGAIGVALFVIGVGGAVLYRRRLALFGTVWVLTTLVFPLLTPSLHPFLWDGIFYSHYTNPHRYYLVEAGFALLIGGGLTLWGRSRPGAEETGASRPIEKEET
ncbi:MAG TPA: hypothetical protein VKU00_19680 [Chthonomonadaceae bacterium]|nr:hypothetical protein [Chthonomonadaceae bacterium]